MCIQAKRFARRPVLRRPWQDHISEGAYAGGGYARRIHMFCPAIVPAVPRRQASHHAMLGPLAPGHAVIEAPACDGLVARERMAVAGFFVRHQVTEGRGRMQPAEYLRHFTHGDLQPCAACAQLLREIVQAFLDKEIVLRCGVRLRPKARLDDVQTQDFSPAGGIDQRGVIVHPQVALEPDDGVGHKARHIREHRPQKLQRRGQCGHECLVVEARVDLEVDGVPTLGQAFGERERISPDIHVRIVLAGEQQRRGQPVLADVEQRLAIRCFIRMVNTGRTSAAWIGRKFGRRWPASRRCRRLRCARQRTSARRHSPAD
ncbi:hypothetical protein COLO4_02084 [Corchorus olitorius]|uniref:Uncharacterized protein n=1 Tax=Corchorus olitorius TaxID=93759 RepID=A0A1R3L1N8_9ROSI|nr:hypothetical protein COLO4_02084 [Corchorus olitorius]